MMHPACGECISLARGLMYVLVPFVLRLFRRPVSAGRLPSSIRVGGTHHVRFPTAIFATELVRPVGTRSAAARFRR